jgi:protein-L-isoaspartate(D-aspartate) O-methyltransferase
VLEVGTGSGYQAAILATLTDKVYSIELIPELARSAGERLARLGYGHVQVKSGFMPRLFEGSTSGLFNLR